ncbi:MAG: transposase, partial [Planctomycetes bacterium]|nr:transposase [Planctomycetota bacterium]
MLARRIGLIDAIDNRLHLLKIHLPYHESDHVLNLAYNALCDGTCLEDLELRRRDEVYLDALGAQRIPDPTTAGDFCRRFKAADVHTLIDTFNEVRQRVWARQPASFFDLARLDMDGTMVETTGECKVGMDISHDGKWGYHAFVLSLAQTGEVLSVVNRSGNRPSHEGAAAEVDRAMRVCFTGGFKRVLLRGDTDFSQTKHLDRWTNDARVQFIFGLDCTNNRHFLADELPGMSWQPLQRPPRYEVKTKPRTRPDNVKERIVKEREFENIRLQSEDVAEMPYRPIACKKSYRLIVVR